MGAIKTKAFKSGDSVAVRLPKELGVVPGTEFTIGQVGTELRLSSLNDEEEGRARVRRMIEELDAIGPVPAEGRQTREDIRLEFPDRPGLY